MDSICNYKVLLDDDNNGVIGYKYNGRYYRLVINKDDKDFDVFVKHYQKLKDFKFRYYAIAQDIVREMRERGRVFKKIGHYYKII